jgi:hypothetical protein
MNTLAHDMVVLDCESSGLSDASYPITIGACGPDLQSWYWVISPLEDWDYWDSFAEGVHGISHATLLEQGRDAFLVAREMNAVFKGLGLVVDSQWDKFWIQKLFEDSGVKMAFTLHVATSLMTEAQVSSYEAWMEKESLSHHAMEDAAVIREQLMTYVSA